jgi:hypothetical protein
MLKYIKHYYVDGENLTQYLTDTNVSSNGKTHPRLDGLDVKLWFIDENGIDFCLSVVPDTTEITDTLGLTTLTFEQWAAIAESHFNARRIEASTNAEFLEYSQKTQAEVLNTTFDNLSMESVIESMAKFNISRIGVSSDPQ